MYRENSFWKIHSLISGSDDTEIKESEKIKPLSDDCPICDEKNCVESCKEGNICIKCGCEINTNITFGQEYRYYGANDSKSSNPQRVGMPANPKLKSAALGSTITKSRTSNYSKPWEIKQTWIGMDYKDRTLLSIFQSIRVKARNAGITGKIIEEAKNIYCLISENKIFRGKNRQALEASCVFEACKKYNVPRSIKEIAAIFGLNTKTMTKGYNKFKAIQKVVNKKMNYVQNAKAFTPVDFIDRFCSILGINKEMTELCKHVADRAYKLEIIDYGHTPISITAGSIFLISGLFDLNITKEQIENAVKISGVTIGKCQSALNREKHRLLPKHILEKLELH